MRRDQFALSRWNHGLRRNLVDRNLVFPELDVGARCQSAHFFHVPISGRSAPLLPDEVADPPADGSRIFLVQNGFCSCSDGPLTYSGQVDVGDTVPSVHQKSDARQRGFN